MNKIAEQMYAKKYPLPENTFIKPGVGVILLNEKDEILFEKRADCGIWGLIGGKIDPGEMVLETLHREVFEETGLKVEVIKLLGIYSNPKDRIVTYLDNGDVAQLLDIVFVVKQTSGELTKSSESLELKFFSIENLPREIVPPAIEPLNDFKANNFPVIK